MASVSGKPGTQVLTGGAGSSTVTTTFPAAPGGANRDLPPYVLPDTQAVSIRDALLNTSDIINRRGPLHVEFSPGAGRLIGLTRTIDPNGTERMAALRNDTTDQLTGFDSSSTMTFTWPIALGHSPYSLFDSKDAQGDGGVLIGTADSPTSNRRLGFWRGASKPAATNLAVSAVARGDATITVTSAIASCCPGHFVYDHATGYLLGVVQSISSNVITLEHKALAAAATAIDVGAVRGLNPRVTTGTITTDVSSITVNGGDTKFSAQGLGSGTWDLFTTDFTYVGTVDTVTSDAQLILTADAAVALSNDDYIAIKQTGSYSMNNTLGFLNASFGGHQFYGKGDTLYWADLVDMEGVDLTQDGNNLQFSSDPARAIIPTLDTLVWLTENEAYGLVGAIGTTPDRWRGSKIHDDGTLCGMSALPYQGGAIWAGKRGIWFFDGATPVNLTASLGDDYRTYVRNATRAWGMIVHNTYFCFIEDGTSNGIWAEYRGTDYDDTDRICISIDLQTGAISWHRNLELRGWLPLPAAITTGTVLFGVSEITPTVKVCNGDYLFSYQGKDEITCEGGAAAGPSLYVETKRYDLGDPQRLKTFKMLLLHYFTNGGNLMLDTVTGMNSAGTTAADQYEDGAGEWLDARVKFMRRGQLCGFRIYESSVSGDPNAEPPDDANQLAVSLGAWSVGYRVKRPGRV